MRHSNRFKMLFIPLLLWTLAPAALRAADEGEKPQGLPVETVQVDVEQNLHTLNAVGTLLANEAVSITTEIAGKVVAVNFEDGQRVAGGKILLRLDQAVLAAQRDRAAANLEVAAANYKRAEALLAEQATSQRERDEANAAWKLAQAELKLAEAQLAKTVLRAPFEGRLGLRMVSPGSYLPPGTEVVTLDDTDPLKLEFRVPEARADELEIGSEVTVSVDAVPGKTFSGSVYAVTPRVATDGRSIALRARVANPRGELLPGMFARVRLTLDEDPHALFVPEEALIPSGDTFSVFKVVDGKVEAAAVSIGQRRPGAVEIVRGLQEGDTVITAGHLKVRPGMPVTSLPAAAAAAQE